MTTEDDPLARVDHVVVLMLENRSFDNILGGLPIKGLNGVPDGYSNDDVNGQPVFATPTASCETRPDPKHDFKSVAAQLIGNRGFVSVYQQEYDLTRAEASQVVQYFAPDDLPVTHRLAKEYLVSDEWYCSAPVGTWPNRMFAVAGTSDGRLINRPRRLPPFLFEMPTVFERLGGDWAVYNDQIPLVCVFLRHAIEWLDTRHEPDSRFRSIRQFIDDAAADLLPRYSFIEPNYIREHANDAHPPHDVLDAEALIARVYLAVRTSPAWDRTLLVVLFDEHGGFFDHVAPPTDAASPGQGDMGFDFKRLGVRVPCLIISPLVDRGIWHPTSGYADHTSIIATVSRRWGLDPLTDRDEAAADLGSALTLSSARSDDDATLEAVRGWLATRDARLEEEGGTEDSMVGLSGSQVSDLVIASVPPELESDLEADVDPDLDVSLRLLAERTREIGMLR